MNLYLCQKYKQITFQINFRQIKILAVDFGYGTHRLVNTMDTFFTIYFILVGGLFMLTLISEIIKFLTGDGEDWQFQLAEDVLSWCLHLYPIRKQKPLLTLVEGKSHLAGEYCFYNNTITIYKDNNVIRQELINTVIHEYFHYYLITSESKSKLYHDQLEQFSLAQHPQEILCNSMGETLTKLYLKQN